MFKKLTFLLPLALLAPLAFGEVLSSSDPLSVAALTSKVNGEYNGYTYTQSDNYRYYDSHDFGPTIVKHLWAPSGFKFSIEINDEQIDLMLDQAESVGIDYKYVHLICKYSKFGIQAYFDSLIEYDLSGREGFRSWIKSEVEALDPFYEIKEATLETDITFNIQFYFTVNDPHSNYNSWNFCFESEPYMVEPFDASEYIYPYVQYWDAPSGNNIFMRVGAHLDDEFFDTSLDGSGLGFRTKNMTVNGDHRDPDYKMTLFAYGAHEMEDITDDYMESSLPTHPVPFSVKLEFTYDDGTESGQKFTVWSEEFIVGDPEFRVTIDGSEDRSNVQKGTEHDYDIKYNNYNESEEVHLYVDVTAEPVRLEAGSNVLEHYDIAIGPEYTNNYYVQGIFNMWGKSSDYVLDQINADHYVLRNVYIEADDDVRIGDDGDHEFYNATTYEDCGYYLDEQFRVYASSTGYYDVDFYPNAEDGNYFTLTEVADPYGVSTTGRFYLTGPGNGFYWQLMDSLRFAVDPQNSSHYTLKGALLKSYLNMCVKEAFGGSVYRNASTYENCGYTITNDGYLRINEEGVYDIDLYLDREDGNYLTFTKEKYYIVGSFNNWTESASYTLNQDLESKNHLSKSIELHEGDSFKVLKDDGTYFTNNETWECCGFTLDNQGNIVVSETGTYNLDFYLKSSQGYHVILRTDVLAKAPAIGEETYLQYVPSDYEVRLHHQGRDEEFLEEAAGGRYYSWNFEAGHYEDFYGVKLIDKYINNDDVESYLEDNPVLQYVGKWCLSVRVDGSVGVIGYRYSSFIQMLDVSAGDKSDVDILLNVPDEVNLLVGADELEIVPTLSSIEEGVDYFYQWSEPSKEGIINTHQEDYHGKLTVTAVGVGTTSLTVEVDCKLFATIKKTITVRVLDQIYDVAKIKVPNEFHYAGKDLTASVSIRGFTNIQNIDVEWKVTNKKGEEIADAKLIVNKDATVTLLKPDSEDYTFVAYYEGVKLDSLTVQVRYTDLNKFLKTNVWWILLMTIGLVVFVVLMRKIFKRGKTTVENIERVYQVFCQCLSDDKLTLQELKTIKKEITRCVHRCEDLNIEALNQYEKAIRYLRKSLGDTNTLIKRWDNISIEDKSAFTEKLNLDLSKALNVAREIENAKDLSEQYHFNANRKNYETIVDDTVGAKGHKSKL